MDYKLSTLPNSLRVLTVPMPSLESVTVTVWVKTGSRNEEKRLNGISHFLEHMVFKGSKKRPTAKDLAEAVDSFGGEQNAFTSKDWTSFYIKSGTGKVEEAIDVLSDMVLNPLIESEEIDRERGTIIQELAMNEDDPKTKIYDVFEEGAFSGNSLGWEIIGSQKSLTVMKRPDFVDYRSQHYYPQNMLVTIAGGISEKKGLNLSEKYFGGSKRSANKERLGKNFKVTQSKPRVNIRSKKSDQAHIIVGFMGNGRNYRNRYAQSVLSGILNGGMSSRLFMEVRERRGLAYAVLPAAERYSETGYYGAYVGTDPGKAEEALRVMLDQFYGMASGKYAIEAKELLKAKEYLKGHLALGLENTTAVNEFFGLQALFLPEILTPEDIYKKVDRVTVKDVVVEAKKLFVPEHLNLAIIGPYSSDGKFRKIIK